MLGSLGVSCFNNFGKFNIKHFDRLHFNTFIRRYRTFEVYFKVGKFSGSKMRKEECL